MDKHTLSQYGWAVIVVIIIAILLGLATPFGNFIGSTVIEVIEEFAEKAGIDPANPPTPEDNPQEDAPDIRPRTTSYLRNIAIEDTDSGDNEGEPSPCEQIIALSQAQGCTREEAFWSMVETDNRADFEAALQAYCESEDGGGITPAQFYEGTFGEGVNTYEAAVNYLNNYSAPAADLVPAFFTSEPYKIVFETSLPDASIETVDISYDRDGSVVGYMTSENISGVSGEQTVMHIAGNGVVRANPDMSGFFKFFGANGRDDNDSLYIVDFNNAVDTSNTTTFKNFFDDCHNLSSLNLAGIKTQAATDISYMFQGCDNLTSLDLSKFDTSKVTHAAEVIWGDKLESVNLNGWDLSSVTNTGYRLLVTNVPTHTNNIKINNLTIRQLISNAKLVGSEVKTWDITKVTSLENAFANQSLESLDLSDWDVSNIISFKDCFYLTSFGGTSELNISGWDLSNATDLSEMFKQCHAEKKNLSGIKLPQNANITNMFESVGDELNLSNVNFSPLKNIDGLFATCSYNTALNLANCIFTGIESANTMWANNSDTPVFMPSVVTTGIKPNDITIKKILGKNEIFYNQCSTWNVSEITDMSGLFKDSSIPIDIDLSNWDVSNVTTMAEMFMNSDFTGINMSGWNTKKVTNMSHMFDDMNYIPTLNISSLDTSNVTDMSYMFADYEIRNIDLSNFNTSKVTTMEGMFKDNDNFLTELDLGSFDTLNNKNFNSMFENCEELTKIHVSSRWVVTGDATTTNMFTNCGTSAVIKPNV